MQFLANLKVGQQVACKYPQHGTRNILCNQIGEAVKVGSSKKNGLFITIKRGDNLYRTLSVNRMIDTVIS
jgi:hypothetical protein|tara:strand:+ start:4723 stop:4932 length:210 start_codon:yes stop_codon:yes gene_type:complete